MKRVKYDGMECNFEKEHNPALRPFKIYCANPQAPSIKFWTSILKRLVPDRTQEEPASCVPEKNGEESLIAETARQAKKHRQQKNCYAGCSDAGAASEMEMGRTPNREEMSGSEKELETKQAIQNTDSRLKNQCFQNLICGCGALFMMTRDNNLCRQCHREPETLAHVLGSCPHSEVLRNSRHHRIHSMIAEQFRSINFQVFEEVHGLADNGSTRKIDMIAIPPNNNNGYIIDPTVRFEKQKSQPEDVNREKNDIYRKQASLVYRSSTRVCVRNCVSIRRPEFECSGPQLEGPEFECSGPQLEGPEFECSGPQLEGPEFEYSGLSLKVCGSRYCELE
ncbi:hypothetical protein ANN_22564 [Periplaneta americana]|uniref:Uncharacterized protein n=1 Tax=Periplaneta americana TaxID=6978 RepID=A0ABQ8S8G9_PERAM|nr:hypothetical protein ANN_22564 [Periplaneta americana]